MVATDSEWYMRPNWQFVFFFFLDYVLLFVCFIDPTGESTSL